MSMSIPWYITVLVSLLFQPLILQQSLNQKVLDFAESKMGEGVGRGECWDLAQQALTFAGARNSTDYRSQTRNSNYIWGKPVSLSQAKPGDIIQYRNFSGKRRETQQNGSWKELGFLAEHHTAILVERLNHGAWKVYQQNNEGQRFVTEDVVHLQDAKFIQESLKIEVDVSGKYWIYRPVSR